MKHFAYPLLSALLFTVFLLSSCTKEVEFLPDAVDMLQVDHSTGLSYINFSFARTALNNLPYENLSYKEEKEILFVLGEEKLATDFYEAMFERWSDPMFRDLYQSEKSHYKATQILIDKYLLEDSTEDNAPGVFTNISLQAFYNHVYALGITSETEAFNVAALLGEANLVTLNNQLSSITNNKDLRLLYKNLLAATRNHFRINVDVLERTGNSYSPQIISQEEYNEIIGSSWDMKAG